MKIYFSDGSIYSNLLHLLLIYVLLSYITILTVKFIYTMALLHHGIALYNALYILVNLQSRIIESANHFRLSVGLCYDWLIAIKTLKSIQMLKCFFQTSNCFWKHQVRLSKTFCFPMSFIGRRAQCQMFT
jgi:hypothetical protein